MYIYHLISIDLQLSRSFNTHTAKLTDDHTDDPTDDYTDDPTDGPTDDPTDDPTLALPLLLTAPVQIIQPTLATLTPTLTQAIDQLAL